MVSPAALLGLSASRPGLPTIPCRAPHYLMFNFIFAYAVIAPRSLKQYLGIDSNISPRVCSSTLGEDAVKSGKITKRQLDMVKRNESAQANAVENYTLFVASIVSAQLAGVPNKTINKAALLYSVARIAYAGAYIYFETRNLSFIRSKLWWVGNFSCLYLLWQAGKLANK